ncbi:diguanylate cyclase [Leptolyngbya sp. Heron Island J]|nr:diguanylate cyclase [Leptolyngbya sp. Heron Island J]
MQLDWRLNAQFAGLCVAEAYGKYRRQGLAVTLKPAPPDLDVIQTVVSQPHTLGCAEESLILAAQAQGVAVVAIATMLQASPLSLMSLPEQNLSHLQQLPGKRIGVHSDGRQALALVLSKNHIPADQIDIVTIPYRDKHQRLINGEFDAVQCYALDEPLDFARRLGQPPTVLTFHQYGFDAYSQVIFAPTQLVTEQPHYLKRFLAATFAGWRWAINHPSQTAQLLVQQYVEPDYQDVNYQTQSLKIIANYVQNNGQTIGTLDPRRWQHSAQQLVEAGLIETLPLLDTSIDLSLWS